MGLQTQVGSMADRVPPVAEVGRSEGRFFFDFGPEMGSRRVGRGLKGFLEAVGFIDRKSVV